MFSPASADPATDLVLSATSRLFWTAPILFIVVCATAVAAAFVLTARNAARMRSRALQHERALQTLRTRERRLRLAVRDSEDGIVHLEPVRGAGGRIVDFLVTDANVRAAALFRRAASDMEGRLASSLASLAASTELFASLVRTAEEGTAYRAEVRAHPRHVATSWLQVRAVPVDSGLSVSLTDIRDRKREAARLRRASLTDELTGVLNRRGFLTLADDRLHAARHAKQSSLLLYLDCDAFKQINDVHGHHTGDIALTHIARALRSAVRETDLVGRIGGDEFTILAVDAIGDCAHTIRTRIAERLDALNESGVLPCAVSVSVGHACAPCDAQPELSQLLELADRDLLDRKHIARSARRAMDAITQSTRPPRVRRKAERAIAGTRLTGAVSAA